MENKIDNTKTKKRIEWVDAAKGLGLILVVLGHLDIPYLPTWIYTFHIPLFFFLSGFVFSGDKYTFKEFLVNKIKTLVVPYFALGGVIYLFWCFIYLKRAEPPSAYLTMFLNFLKQEHFWTVWFLACLFLVEIIYYLINKISKKILWANSIISVCLLIIGFIWYRFGGRGLPWNFDVALVAQFFFHLGYLFKKYPSAQMFFMGGKFSKSFLLLIGLGAINVVFGYLCIRVSGKSLDMSIGMYGNEILSLISAVAGILCAVIFCKRFPFAVLKFLGQNTMLIFAWHSRIIIVFMNYLYRVLNVFQGEGVLNLVVGSLITFIVIFAVLVPINELVKRTKLKFMIGR